MGSPGGKISAVQILTDSITTDTSDSIKGWTGRMTFQAHGLVSASTGAATILIEGSLDDSQFLLLGTLTLALTTAASSDGIAVDAPWRFMRARISAISGTDATVQVFAGG